MKNRKVVNYSTTSQKWIEQVCEKLQTYVNGAVRRVTFEQGYSLKN